jgi:ATP-binding protein involved in chromosome partitioning
MNASITPDAVLSALSKVIDPGQVQDLRIDPSGEVQFKLQPAGSAPLPANLRREAESAVMALPGVAKVQVLIGVPRSAPGGAGGLPPKRAIPGVRRVVAVSSGKGGVGKSTVAVNLACALQRSGHRVGILDGDVYGPNIPTMLGVRGKPSGTADRIDPFLTHGMQVMSMGMLVPEEQPMIWRGPMLNKAVQQFMFQVGWHDLDWLIVDMPPGTGDVQLTLAQNTNVDGAVVVTTPQLVSVQDVRKAVRMFGQMEIPVLGIVENMSWFQPPGHDERYEIFGSGGGRRIADEFRVPLLGQIPIGLAVREGGDSGEPITLADPDSPIAQAFMQAAEQLVQRTESVAAGGR